MLALRGPRRRPVSRPKPTRCAAITHGGAVWLDDENEPLLLGRHVTRRCSHPDRGLLANARIGVWNRWAAPHAGRASPLGFRREPGCESLLIGVCARL